MANSPIDIARKLAALDIALSDAEADFDRSASEAVAGVDGAGGEAATANAKIERLKIERKILLRAQAKAVKRENEDAAKVEAEACRQHVNAARRDRFRAWWWPDHMSRSVPLADLSLFRRR